MLPFDRPPVDKFKSVEASSDRRAKYPPAPDPVPVASTVTVMTSPTLKPEIVVPLVKLMTALLGDDSELLKSVPELSEFELVR